MSWMGTPLLLMMDTAVCRPSWACQWPMPALLVILENCQLSPSDEYGAPFSRQNTRSLSCQASPACSRSVAWRFWWVASALMARLGSSSERFDLGVLVSPVLLADFHTWI